MTALAISGAIQAVAGIAWFNRRRQLAFWLSALSLVALTAALTACFQ